MLDENTFDIELHETPMHFTPIQKAWIKQFVNLRCNVIREEYEKKLDELRSKIESQNSNQKNIEKECSYLTEEFIENQIKTYENIIKSDIFKNATGTESDEGDDK